MGTLPADAGRRQPFRHGIPQGRVDEEPVDEQDDGIGHPGTELPVRDGAEVEQSTVGRAFCPTFGEYRTLACSLYALAFSLYES